MPNSGIKKIIKKYADLLDKNNIVFIKMYLFGSYAKGCYKKDSDVDVAIVLNRVPEGKKYLEQKSYLRKLAALVDTRIDPVILEKKELKRGNTSPISYEVLKHGIVVG